VSRPTPLTKWPKRPRSRQDRALRNYVRASLVAARTHSGLLQDEAARLAGLSRSVMACIERGRQVPSILQLYRLARAYRISPSRFLP
jgi:DNA-binding XRE family transcriptional regulator